MDVDFIPLSQTGQSGQEAWPDKHNVGPLDVGPGFWALPVRVFIKPGCTTTIQISIKSVSW